MDVSKKLRTEPGAKCGVGQLGTDGRKDVAEIAAEFARLKVDVILTHNTPTVLAAKQATSVIPIVFATAGDPIGSGLVANLARPGGNVTGISSQRPILLGSDSSSCASLSPVCIDLLFWPISPVPIRRWS